MDNTERKITLQESRLYIWMQHTSRILDHYGLDGIIGLVPGGIGDVFTLGITLFFYGKTPLLDTDISPSQ